MQVAVRMDLTRWIALSCLLLITSVCGASGEPASRQAAALLAAGDSAGAGQLLESSLDQDKKDYAGYILRGQLRLARQDFSGAEKDFRRALNSGDPAVRSNAYLGIGDIIRGGSEGHLTQAVEQLRRAVQVDSTNREALYRMAEAGFELGDNKGYDVASFGLTRLVCLDPEYRGTLELWRTKFVSHTGDEMRRVCTALEARAGRDSLRGRYYLYAGQLRFKLGDYEPALAALERAGQDAASFKPAERELLRARCRLALGDTTGFEQLYGKALEAAAGDGDFAALMTEAEAIFTPVDAGKWEQIESPEQGVAFFRAFWARRDPDPLTPFNERRVTHYARLARAQELYPLSNPHSKFQTSSDYRRLTYRMSRTVDYDPVEVFGDRGRALDLDQRGVLFVRFGPPELLNKPEIDKSPNPAEIWQYKDSGFFVFEKSFGAGDFVFMPSRIPGAGDIKKALVMESFDDPLPALDQDNYSADFKGLDGGVELEFYQSTPLAASSAAPSAVTALFDSTWSETTRDSAVSVLVCTPADTFWLGINRLSARPGECFQASKMEIPGRRAVARNELKLASYDHSLLDISGIVLGSSPPLGAAPLERAGVALLPRPSLRFTSGEKITVYLEVYNLSPDSAGIGRFQERVTVTRNEEKSALARLLGLSSQKREKSLSMSFERMPENNLSSVPESFEIDTSPLLPGVYDLRIEVTDRVSGTQSSRGCAFEIMERR